MRDQDRWDNLSYHRSLENAVLRLAEIRVRSIEGEFPAESLIGFCQALDSLKREIKYAVANTNHDPLSNGDA